MSRQYFIYILTNKHNKVLYVGVTNDLYRRFHEHKNRKVKGFTYKYNLDKLVYFEEFEYIDDALEREKQLKRWHKDWKINLVNKNNKKWQDLSKNIM